MPLLQHTLRLEMSFGKASISTALVNIRKLLDQKRRFKSIIDKMIHNFEIKNLYKWKLLKYA